MTVSAIVTRAKNLANVSGSSIFDNTELTDSLNAAYRDVYEKICDADDDFFITDWSFTLASMAAVSGDSGAYTIALPSSPTALYRLRTLEYLRGSAWRPLHKYALQDEYKRSSGPVYRFKGSYLLIYIPDPTGVSTFRAWYYPKPTAYDVATGGSTDIATPPQLEVDLIAYQMAIDICRKAVRESAHLEARRNELWGRFLNAISRRDDFDTQRIANVYQTSWGL